MDHFSPVNFNQEAYKAMKGVVQIYVEGLNENDEQAVLNPQFVTLAQWTASGFFILIDNDWGHILTNAHVIRNALTIHISNLLTSEERFEVEVVGMNDDLDPDVGLLRLKRSEIKRFKMMTEGEMPFIKLSHLDSIKRGTPIKAIGHPLGMDEPNITAGEITNFISGVYTGTEKYVTDAAINPGNSGGPAIIPGGEAIGLNTAVMTNATGIGFITPIHYVKIVLKNLINKKDIQFTSLGGRYQKNSMLLANYLGRKTDNGVIVAEVFAGGILERAGLKKKDVLLAVNDCTLNRHGVHEKKGQYRNKGLLDILRLIPLGAPVKLSFARANRVFHRSVRASCCGLDDIPSRPVISKRKFVVFHGMIIQELSAEIYNCLADISDDFVYTLWKSFHENSCPLVITSVGQGSLAYELGLSAGDLIVSVNKKKLRERTLEQFVVLMESEIKKCRKGSGKSKMKLKEQRDGPLVLETKTGKMAIFHSEHLKSEVVLKTPLHFYRKVRAH